MLYFNIFSCYILVKMIDAAADPEKLIFQKALLLALDQRKTLLLEQDQIIRPHQFIDNSQSSPLPSLSPLSPAKA